MTKRKEPERLERIDVVRHENGKIHVLGESYNIPESFLSTSLGILFGGVRYLNHIVHNASTGEIISEERWKNAVFWGNHKLDYWEQVKEFQEANMSDLREKVKDMEVHQGTLEEVSQRLGRELEYVDTRRANKFIKTENLFNLRVKAHCLGADAIVHYQPGSSVGTPVKYK